MTPEATGLFRQFNLFEIKFDRRFAAKDRNRYLDAVFVEIQFFDDAVEACKWAVEYLDLIADFVIDGDFGFWRFGGFFAGV